jgi:hypothetical protein
MNLFDLLEQQFVLLLPHRYRPVFEFVIARPGHAEQPAGHRDIDTIVGEFMDQPERYFGRMFSFAK